MKHIKTFLYLVCILPLWGFGWVFGFIMRPMIMGWISGYVFNELNAYRETYKTLLQQYEIQEKQIADLERTTGDMLAKPIAPDISLATKEK